MRTRSPQAMAPPGAMRRLGPLIMPYAVMLVGLHGIGSAWGAMLAYHAIAVVWMGRSRGRVFRLLTAGRDARFLAVAIVFGAIGGLLMHALAPWLDANRSLHAMMQDALATYGFGERSWIAFAAYHGIVNPVVEEAYWRGWLGSPARGLRIEDVAFAGYHLVVLAPFIEPIWLGVSLVSLTAAAWLWRRARVHTGGLAPAVASHMAADVSIMWVLTRHASG